MPRTASSAFARVAWRYTNSLSSACRGIVDAHVLGHRRRPPLLYASKMAIHVADVASAEPARQHRRIAVVAVPPTESRVVGDVAGALLEVAHQPTPLEHLGQHVRRLLARQVHPTQLGDGVVAVLEEHLLVQLLGSLQTDGRIDRLVAADVEVADELVEEQTPQLLRLRL